MGRKVKLRKSMDAGLGLVPTNHMYFSEVLTRAPHSSRNGKAIDIDGCDARAAGASAAILLCAQRGLCCFDFVQSLRSDLCTFC